MKKIFVARRKVSSFHCRYIIYIFSRFLCRGRNSRHWRCLSVSKRSPLRYSTHATHHLPPFFFFFTSYSSSSFSCTRDSLCLSRIQVPGAFPSVYIYKTHEDEEEEEEDGRMASSSASRTWHTYCQPLPSLNLLCCIYTYILILAENIQKSPRHLTPSGPMKNLILVII